MRRLWRALMGFPAVVAACGDFDANPPSAPAAAINDAAASTPANDATIDSAADAAKEGGGCAYDCRGGMCVAGRCQPVRIAPAEDLPDRIAARGNTLYWTARPGKVRACDVETCAPSDFASPSIGVRNIAAADQRIFVTSGGCGDTIAGRTTVLMPDGTATMFGVAGFCSGGVSAVGTAHVLYVDPGAVTSKSSSSVVRFAGDGGRSVTVTSDAVEPPTEGVPLLVAGTATLTFVTTAKGFIRKYPGGAQVASGQTEVVDIAASETAVVWARTGPGAGAAGVWRLAMAGGSPSRIVPDNTPRGIAIDGSGVYWTTLGSTPEDGRLMRLAPGTTVPETLANAQRSPSGVLLTKEYVVWANEGGSVPGSVMRLAKPPP